MTSSNGNNGVAKLPTVGNDKPSSLYSVPIEILILVGSTWSGLACVAGASVVTVWRNNWVLPSLLSALWFCLLPALVAVGWLYFNNRASHTRFHDGKQGRLKIQLGPEAWS
eukprot:CAMPEP_0169082282 /NCGR_PEP_ID=MMETSP1015-20121227/11462_1 /TAXON_ID=342587 /ORGANISM="Karlodinium micrum, Strain CCMP2283" /LENGTH=110 /DNA_ID=CAMNT_0009142129 /DNA_START=43 /DNA_END=371 /DNA_ORIENTATION=+